MVGQRTESFEGKGIEVQLVNLVLGLAELTGGPSSSLRYTFPFSYVCFVWFYLCIFLLSFLRWRIQVSCSLIYEYIMFNKEYDLCT